MTGIISFLKIDQILYYLRINKINSFVSYPDVTFPNFIFLQHSHTEKVIKYTELVQQIIKIQIQENAVAIKTVLSTKAQFTKHYDEVFKY
jgi:hypothetical protein